MGGPRRSDDEVRRRRGLVNQLRQRGMKQKAIARKLGIPLRTIQRDYEAITNSLYERLKAQAEVVKNQLRGLSDDELITFMMGSPEERSELWEKIQARSSKK